MKSSGEVLRDLVKHYKQYREAEIEKVMLDLEGQKASFTREQLEAILFVLDMEAKIDAINAEALLRSIAAVLGGEPHE